MKKTFIAFCAVVFSAVASAASIAWGSANPLASVSTSPSGGSIGNYMAYLCVGSSTIDAVTALTNGTWAAPTIGAGDTVVSQSLTPIGTTGKASVNSSIPSLLGSSFTAGSAYDFFVVIIDEANSYAQVSSVVSATPYNETGTDPMSKALWDAAALTGNGWFAIGDENVPEPTALALLALGVAGVALRRRKMA